MSSIIIIIETDKNFKKKSQRIKILSKRKRQNDKSTYARII